MLSLLLVQRFPECTDEQIMVIAGIPREEIRHTRAVQDWPPRRPPTGSRQRHHPPSRCRLPTKRPALPAASTQGRVALSGHLCVIEPFDPARHDRTGFSCGVAAVDNSFKKTANKLAKAGNVKLFASRSCPHVLSAQDQGTDPSRPPSLP